MSQWAVGGSLSVRELGPFSRIHWPLRISFS